MMQWDFERHYLSWFRFIESYFFKVFSPFCRDPFSHVVTFVRAFFTFSKRHRISLLFVHLFVSCPSTRTDFPGLFTVLFFRGFFFFLAIFFWLHFPPLRFYSSISHDHLFTTLRVMSLLSNRFWNPSFHLCLWKYIRVDVRPAGWVSLIFFFYLPLFILQCEFAFFLFLSSKLQFLPPSCFIYPKNISCCFSSLQLV